MKIKKIQRLKETAAVYDVQVKGTHNYILENGIISHNSMSPLPVTGGGDGPKYSSDVTLILSKAKEKDGTEHVGANITLRVDKSRYQPEGQKYKIMLLFDKGIYKYSNLLDWGLDFEILKKEGFSIVFPDGTKKRRKEVIKNAQKYFTDEVILMIQEKVKAKYSFGSSEGIDVDFDEDEESLDDEEVTK